ATLSMPPSVVADGLGNRDAGSVPEEIFAALVVSIVADAANDVPFVFVTVRPPELEMVASPLTATSAATLELLPTNMWALVSALLCAPRFDSAPEAVVAPVPP